MPRRNTPKSRKKPPYIASPTLDVAPTPYIACREKRRFHTEKEALYDAETRMLMDMQLELTVYKCPYCRGWHLTHADTH